MKIYKDDCTVLAVQADIEGEAVKYYTNLFGTSDNKILHIDLAAMRDAPHLNISQCES